MPIISDIRVHLTCHLLSTNNRKEDKTVAAASPPSTPTAHRQGGHASLRNGWLAGFRLKGAPLASFHLRQHLLVPRSRESHCQRGRAQRGERGCAHRGGDVRATFQTWQCHGGFAICQLREGHSDVPSCPGPSSLEQWVSNCLSWVLNKSFSISWTAVGKMKMMSAPGRLSRISGGPRIPVCKLGP